MFTSFRIERVVVRHCIWKVQMRSTNPKITDNKHLISSGRTIESPETIPEAKSSHIRCLSIQMLQHRSCTAKQFLSVSDEPSLVGCCVVSGASSASRCLFVLGAWLSSCLGLVVFLFGLFGFCFSASFFVFGRCGLSWWFWLHVFLPPSL